MKNVEDFMDNREKRIAFAFMELEGRKDRLKRLRQPDRIRNKMLFIVLLSFLLVAILCMLHR